MSICGSFLPPPTRAGRAASAISLAKFLQISPDNPDNTPDTPDNGRFFMQMQPDEPTTDGIWLSVSELAAAKGISRQSMHERIRRLEAQNLLTPRLSGRNKLVSLAQFDHVSRETTDLVRQSNGSAKPLPDTDTATTKALSYSQARKAEYDADIKKMELEERQGKLIRVEVITDAMTRCAEALVREIEQIPTKADDLATAVAKNGTQGARGLLKLLARDLRENLARNLRILTEADDDPDERTD